MDCVKYVLSMFTLEILLDVYEYATSSDIRLYIYFETITSTIALLVFLPYFCIYEIPVLDIKQAVVVCICRTVIWCS